MKKKQIISNLIIVFIIFQAIIDIFTSLCIDYISPSFTVGIVIRAIFMAFAAIYGLVCEEKKERIKLFIYYALIGVYAAIFLANSYNKFGANMLFTQLKGIIKTFYLPVVLAGLIPIFKKNEIEISNKNLCMALFGYTLTIFLSKIAGISYNTYKIGNNAGTVGLFFSANEIGAIISLLAPFIVCLLMENKNKVFAYISLVFTIFAILEIGTKVPYLGFIFLIIAVIIIAILNIKGENKKSYKNLMIGAFVTFISMYLVTGYMPAGRNLEATYGNIFLRFENSSEEDEEIRKKQLKDINDVQTAIVSGRNNFFKNNLEIYKSGSILDKAFGIGYIEIKNDRYQELKLVEMDYFDIIFCDGIIGTILFMIPIIIIGFNILKNGFKKIKVGIKNLEVMLLLFSIAITFATALLAGHILVSPAVSIFLAVILIAENTKLEKLQIN